MFRIVLLFIVLLPQVNATVFNIRDFGAVGDGTTDDTTAILTAINRTVVNGGVLYIPTGNYLVQRTLNIHTDLPLTIQGDGMSSVLLWAFDGNLFQLSAADPGHELALITVRDFMVTSSRVKKSLDRYAIYAEGLVKSQLEHLYFNSNDAIQAPFPSGIAMVGVADTNTVRDVLMWEIHGTGIEIGHGSEIRILGGRIIGPGNRTDPSIGIHCTGNNGGVHIENTDIIALGMGVLIENSSGAGSNREIFISHATIDSNGRGLVIRDSSYVSIIGLWAASSTQDQIYIDENTSALLSISGGTIFNGGVYECPDPSGGCNGLTARSGTFILTGVEVRNNHGRGIWVPNPSMTQYQIIACRIFANGQGLNVTGNGYIISNNICRANQYPNAISGKDSSIVVNNLGC